MMERVQTIIKKVETHDSVRTLYRALVLTAFLVKQRYYRHTKLRLTEPSLRQKVSSLQPEHTQQYPLFNGLEKIDFLTSDNLWDIRELPKKLVDYRWRTHWFRVYSVLCSIG